MNRIYRINGINRINWINQINQINQINRINRIYRIYWISIRSIGFQSDFNSLLFTAVSGKLKVCLTNDFSNFFSLVSGQFKSRKRKKSFEHLLRKSDLKFPTYLMIGRNWRKSLKKVSIKLNHYLYRHICLSVRPSQIFFTQLTNKSYL